MIEKENEVVQEAWLAMGAALLRIVRRQGESVSPVAEAAFLDAMKALAAADLEKSVCAALPPELLPAVADWKTAGLAGSAGSGAPLVLDGEAPDVRIYAARQFAEEAELARRLMKAHRLPDTGLRLPQALADEFSAVDHAFFDQTPQAADLEKTKAWEAGVARQREAVEKALARRFSVITGGPGTGKTSTVVRILTALLAASGDKTRIVLTAPTGKAAGRMMESVSKECEAHPALYAKVQQAIDEKRVAAQTIHRLLLTPDESGEKPSETSPLSADILIADEASMIDQRLALRLLRVTNCETTRLVFLGDKYQLAAVGPGSVFADITDPEGALSDAVTELTYSFRFGDASPIGCAARAVNAGDGAAALRELPVATRFSTEKIFNASEWAASAASRVTTERVNPKIVAWIDAAMPVFLAAVAARVKVHAAHDLTEGMERETLDKAMLDAFNDFRILCAQRRGRDSVTAVNALMAEKVRKAAGAASDAEFYPGRIVIVRANDRTTDLFNGDVGVVTYGEKDGFEVWFGDRYVPAALLPAHDTGYSLTVHQSQGSQFKSVAVVLSDDPESALTTRELLYTGITRAKKNATVFAAKAALEKAVKTPVRRLGGLARRLRENAEES